MFAMRWRAWDEKQRGYGLLGVGVVLGWVQGWNRGGYGLLGEGVMLVWGEGGNQDWGELFQLHCSGGVVTDSALYWRCICLHLVQFCTLAYA